MSTIYMPVFELVMVIFYPSMGRRHSHFKRKFYCKYLAICLPSTQVPKDILEAGLTSFLKAEAGQILPLSATWPLACGTGLESKVSGAEKYGVLKDQFWQHQQH